MTTHARAVAPIDGQMHVPGADEPSICRLAAVARVALVGALRSGGRRR